jgi:hypothetical protein
MKMNHLVMLTLVAAMFSFNAEASGFTTSIVGVGDYSKIGASNAPTSGTYSGINVTNISTSYSAKLGLGGGLLFTNMLSPRLGFELGGLYITRKTDVTTSFTALGLSQGSTSTTTTRYIQIPILMRVRLTRGISVGGGGYFAEGVGSVDPTIKKTDYGLVGSLALHFPIGHTTAFLIDGRYNLGLKNVDNSGSGADLKYRDYQLLVGFAF